MLKKVFAVCLVGLLAGPVFAQEAGVKLAKKFAEGTLTYNTEVKLSQVLTIVGMEQKSETNNFVTTQKVTKDLGNDQFSVAESIKRIQVNVDVNGQSLSFDSENPDGANASPAMQPMVMAVKAQMKAKPTFTINGKTNKVVSVEMEKSALESLPAALKPSLSDDALKKKYEQSQAAYTTKTLKPGETWDATTEADLGGGQTLTFETTYTYVGPETVDGMKLHKITSKVNSVEFDIDPNGGLPVDIKNSDLKIKASSGTLFYSEKLGAYASEDEKVQIVGSLTLAINGMDLPGKLDLTMHNKTKIEK